MEEKNYHKEVFSFRIIGLQPKMLDLLKATLADVEIVEGKHWKTNESVITFDLYEKRDYTDLYNFISQNKIQENSYGFYASLVTNRDNDGISLPVFMLILIQKIGGSIDFSFTCVLDND